MNKYYFLVCLLLATHLLFAQETLSSTGGDASGTGGSSSYTVGLVFYTYNSSSVGSVSQGVQQVFEIQTLSNPALLTVQLTAVIYPNPITDYVVLKITDTALENLRYTFFDFNDESIASKTITISNILINM